MLDIIDRPPSEPGLDERSHQAPDHMPEKAVAGDLEDERRPRHARPAAVDRSHRRVHDGARSLKGGEVVSADERDGSPLQGSRSSAVAARATCRAGGTAAARTVPDPVLVGLRHGAEPRVKVVGGGFDAAMRIVDGRFAFIARVQRLVVERRTTRTLAT